MAIPVISPLAAKAAPLGKATNSAGTDQGAADFAAVLAQQRPADPGGERSPLAPQAQLSAAANTPTTTLLLPVATVSSHMEGISIVPMANAEMPHVELSKIHRNSKNLGFSAASKPLTEALTLPHSEAAESSPAPWVAIAAATAPETFHPEFSRTPTVDLSNQGISAAANSPSAANHSAQGIAIAATADADTLEAEQFSPPAVDLKNQGFSAAANSPTAAIATPLMPSSAANPPAPEITIAATANVDTLQVERSRTPAVDLKNQRISAAANSPTVAMPPTLPPETATNPQAQGIDIAAMANADPLQETRPRISTTDLEKPGISTATSFPVAATAIPLVSVVAPNPPAQESANAATAETETLPAELPGTPVVDLKNQSKIAANPATGGEKENSEKDLRGQANALEQLVRNPGLGLGLIAAAGIAGQPTENVEKAGKRPDNDYAANSVEALLAPSVAPVTVPVTFPATSRFDDLTAASPLFTAGSAVTQPPSESLSQTANLAGESLAPGSGSQPTFSAALAAQPASAGAEAAKASPPNVDTPLHNPNWGRGFGEGIVWMAKNDQQSAQININPPQLGPIQITLHLNGEQASAVFASPHAEVRQAIQEAMPQLRDMLAASGINLGQADVGSQGSTPGREFAAQQGNRNRSGDENAILSPDTQFADKSPGQPILRGRGLVDLFA